MKTLSEKFKTHSNPGDKVIPLGTKRRISMMKRSLESCQSVKSVPQEIRKTELMYMSWYITWLDQTRKMAQPLKQTV